MKASYYLYPSSPTTEFYDPKTFFTHAALLGQTFVHCRRFPTAASHRSS
ncbi:permease, partial [Vibrio parahaemolyticus]